MYFYLFYGGLHFFLSFIKLGAPLGTFSTNSGKNTFIAEAADFHLTKVLISFILFHTYSIPV